jgi:hypothetical protein
MLPTLAGYLNHLTCARAGVNSIRDPCIVMFSEPNNTIPVNFTKPNNFTHLATSIIWAVPELGSTAPKPQASRWFPNITYLESEIECFLNLLYIWCQIFWGSKTDRIAVYYYNHAHLCGSKESYPMTIVLTYPAPKSRIPWQSYSPIRLQRVLPHDNRAHLSGSKELYPMTIVLTYPAPKCRTPWQSYSSIWLQIVVSHDNRTHLSCSKE